MEVGVLIGLHPVIAGGPVVITIIGKLLLCQVPVAPYKRGVLGVRFRWTLYRHHLRCGGRCAGQGVVSVGRLPIRALIPGRGARGEVPRAESIRVWACVRSVWWETASPRIVYAPPWTSLSRFVFKSIGSREG